MERRREAGAGAAGREGAERNARPLAARWRSARLLPRGGGGRAAGPRRGGASSQEGWAGPGTRPRPHLPAAGGPAAAARQAIAAECRGPGDQGLWGPESGSDGVVEADLGGIGVAFPGAGLSFSLEEVGRDLR